MTIWMGEKGSPAVYRGTFSADGNMIEGEWEWTGGGYKETMTRAGAQRGPGPTAVNVAPQLLGLARGLRLRKQSPETPD
jgi:hypothetical protein